MIPVRRFAPLFLLIGALASPGAAWPQKPVSSDASRPSDLTRGERARRVPAFARSTRAPAALVTETEPNGDAAGANRIALGDQATGEVDPEGDIDVFVVQVDAGTMLDLDVDAWDVGSPLDPVLCLYTYDPARDTATVYLACNDDYGGSLDSRVTYAVPATGDYYVEISGYAGQGGPGLFYTINVRVRAPGPGDPTTVVAVGLQNPAGLAVDDQGNLFVAEVTAGRVTRIGPDGGLTVVASGISWPVHVAFDGFGDLLVTSDDGTVYQVGSDGGITPFLTGMGFPCWLAIGPDGTIWVADYDQYRIHVFDPFGAPVRSIDATNTAGPFFLAFSPAGVLYVSDFYGIYRLVTDRLEPVFSGYVLEGFAFDVEGNLYLGNEAEGVVTRYAAGGAVLANPFAVTNAVLPLNVAFGRDAGGATNGHLFVANWGSGTVMEVNPAGVPDPGWPVGISLLRLAGPGPRAGVMGAAYADTLAVTDPAAAPTWSIRSGALPPGIALDPATGVLSGVPEVAGAFSVRVRAEAGPAFGEGTYTISITEPALNLTGVADLVLGVEGALTADEMRYLDLIGNGNGRFDLGDFRAYVQRFGVARAARRQP